MITRLFAYSDGIPTMRDSDISFLYDKMVRDGTADVVFYDGLIKSKIEFVRYMKSCGMVLLVVYDDENPIACGWLNSFENNMARAHFCVFSEAWEISVEVGQLLISKSIEFTNVDMLIGYIPMFNRQALNFAKKCGAMVLGELPAGSRDREGDFNPTTIVYYVR